MQSHAPPVSVSDNANRARLFWLLAILSTLLLYWLCLRFLQPGYFAPDSVYHIDFYDYAGMRLKSAMRLLLHYPRPVSFLAMKLLGYGGLYWTMMSAVALALVNLLLTVWYVRRVFRVNTLWMAPALILYLLLNLAHPSFYVEHRHDLPAQVSYFFLVVSLLAWLTWLELPGARRLAKAAILIVALVSVVCFAFSKETYFVTAVCLVAAIALSDRAWRLRSVCFLCFVLAAEVASLLWTRHVNSPFVNPNATADSTYRISLAPASVFETFAFYAYCLVTPAVAVILLVSLYFAWRHRLPLLHLLAFPVAAFAAFAPHSILPNHRFAEYAWVGAPLLLAPLLLLGAGSCTRRLAAIQILTLTALSVVAIWGWDGYVARYDTEEMTWVKQQEKVNSAIVRSFERFRGLPASTRILVLGLEDAVVPWQMMDYIRSEFGDDVYWTVVFPPDVRVRRNSRIIAFADAADVQLNSFDYAALYHPSGELAEFRTLDKRSVPAKLPSFYVPVIDALVKRAAADPTLLLDSADATLRWGFASEAFALLERARQQGAGGNSRYAELTARAAGITDRQQAATTLTASLTANPAAIPSDGTGLGVTELSWHMADGVAVEIHVDAPDGPMFVAATTSGHARTDKWVKDGTEFFLQNVTGGKPLTRDNTLATLKVKMLQ